MLFYSFTYSAFLHFYSFHSGLRFLRFYSFTGLTVSHSYSFFALLQFTVLCRFYGFTLLQFLQGCSFLQFLHFSRICCLCCFYKSYGFGAFIFYGSTLLGAFSRPSTYTFTWTLLNVGGLGSGECQQLCEHHALFCVHGRERFTDFLLNHGFFRSKKARFVHSHLHEAITGKCSTHSLHSRGYITPFARIVSTKVRKVLTDVASCVCQSSPNLARLCRTSHEGACVLLWGRLRVNKRPNITCSKNPEFNGPLVNSWPGRLLTLEIGAAQKLLKPLFL